jgi:type III secretion system FlhB-like substrate exporter
MFFGASVGLLLLLVGCASFDTSACSKQCKIYIFMFIHYGINLFLINLQERIPTVTAEGAGNVGEEDWIEIKTEDDCAQLAATIKTEEEVSGFCRCVLWCRFIYKLMIFGASVDLFVLLVGCASFNTSVCDKQCKIYIFMFIRYGINLFLINLQERIPTVTAEGTGNVGEEDWIEIKTEESCAQLAATIKTEEEVSVLCWCVLRCRFIYKCVCVCVCVCVCGLYCTVYLVINS